MGGGGLGGTKRSLHELPDAEAVDELGKVWKNSVKLLLVFFHEKANWFTEIKKKKKKETSQNSGFGKEQ